MKPSAASSSASPIAAAGAIAPDATGRKRFVGCARSADASNASLKQYTALDKRQNDTNPKSADGTDATIAWRAANASGARTNAFFTQCDGRSSFQTASSALVSAREELATAAKAAGLAPL